MQEENENITTIESTEKWEETYELIYKCNNCNYTSIRKEFKYCPNCGKKIIQDYFDTDTLNNSSNKFCSKEDKQELKKEINSVYGKNNLYSIDIGGRGNGKSIHQLNVIQKLCKSKEFKLCQFSERMLGFILEDEFPNYDISCKRKYDNEYLIFNIYFMSDNFFNYYIVAGNMILNDVIATLKEIIPNGKEEK